MNILPLDFAPARWRLLYTPPARGAWNMAVDEAVLDAVSAGEALPTLRLYAWQPPCISLGFAQPVGDVDRQRLEERGWELVRRPTGGRAILHADELTYAVIAPLKEPRLAGSVLQSYQRLAQALLSALDHLGLPAEAKERYLPPGTAATANPVCFEVPSNYEITAAGKKLVGSAQARRKGGTLQHGSLPLSGDLSRITGVLRFPDETNRAEAAERVLAHAATAENILGSPLSWETAAAAFAQAFAYVLNMELVLGDLTLAEQQRAEELVRMKYDLLSWNEKL